MSDILIYENDRQQIEVRLASETVWLNRQQMAQLFGRDVKTIGKHIANVFREGELEREAVVAKFATTAADGKTSQVEYYNLDVIISVGYHVKSLQGTRFRIWATQRCGTICSKAMPSTGSACGKMPGNWSRRWYVGWLPDMNFLAGDTQETNHADTGYEHQ